MRQSNGSIWRQPRQTQIPDGKDQSVYVSFAGHMKVEHNGCWIAFWGLLAAIILQSILFGSKDFKMLAGEWIVFMVLSIYLAVGCVLRGIWDRRIQMNTKTNLMISTAAALVMGGLIALMVFRNTHHTDMTVISSLITVAVTFVLCFAALKVSMKMTDRRQKQLEEEPEDANIM